MRKNRELKNGAEYHVTARINRGEMAFESEADKNLLLDVFKRAKKKFDFHIKNFCIMNNHLHLLIKPGKGESLSKIMQWILSVFAMNWNRRHHLTGHVWGERFFSRIIAGIVDFLRTFMYIDDNPVIAKLVSESREWEFGGLWHHRREIPGVIDKPDPLTAHFFPEHGMIF
jgi:putative transposase